MKKIIVILLFLTFLLALATCTNQTPDIEQTTTQAEATTLEEVTSVVDWDTLGSEPPWPDVGPCPEGGFDLDGITFMRFRPLYYDIPRPLADLARQEGENIWHWDNTVRNWKRSRTPEEFHNVSAAVRFIQHFNISREDFERANEESRLTFRDRVPEDHHGVELFPVDLIFSFDNERINEFFRWENSIFAHEVGLPNPLRGDWDEDGVWHDHPNWTENPGWREHPFWEYLPFNPANAGH